MSLLVFLAYTPMTTRENDCLSGGTYCKMLRCLSQNRACKVSSSLLRVRGPQCLDAGTALEVRLLSDFPKREDRDKTYSQKVFDRVADSLYTKSSQALTAFDELVGISEVRDAQEGVRKAEDEFLHCRTQVQECKMLLENLNIHLREIRSKLDRIPRDDEKYLALALEEHKLLMEEKKLRADYELKENKERDTFAFLSAIVRDSHEKERARAERTKHWSIMGSVGGAALGIFGSSLVNYWRLKEIRNTMASNSEILISKTNELEDLIRAREEVKEEVRQENVTAGAAAEGDIGSTREDLSDLSEGFEMFKESLTDINAKLSEMNLLWKGNIDALLSQQENTTDIAKLLSEKFDSESVLRKIDSNVATLTSIATSHEDPNIEHLVSLIKEQNMLLSRMETGHALLQEAVHSIKTTAAGASIGEFGTEGKDGDTVGESWWVKTNLVTSVLTLAVIVTWVWNH